MDATLLTEWLNLPPGPWPPDPRTLLGFGPGPVGPADAERAALARMAKLRPHQLVHPDLVTEGMNRLAQAVLAVGSAAPAPAPVVATRAAPPVVARPVVVAEPEPVALTNAPLESIPIDAAPTPAGVGREGRRLLYRQLAGLRRLAQAWDLLRPVAADPSAAVGSPAEVCLALEAQAAFRAALRHPGVDRAEATRLAPGLAAVFARPDALQVLRGLSRGQRGRVAREWAAGRARVRAWQESVRMALRAGPRGGTIGRAWRAWAATARANPEWLVVLVGLLGGIVAVARANGR